MVIHYLVIYIPMRYDLSYLGSYINILLTGVRCSILNVHSFTLNLIFFFKNIHLVYHIIIYKYIILVNQYFFYTY